MTSILRCIHNLASLLVLGKDQTCACTCGSNQVYQVVPYTGDQFGVNYQISWLGGIITEKDADIMFGLLLGLFLSWVLLLLDKAGRSDCGFCWRIRNSRRLRSFFGRLYPKTRHDSSGTTVQDGDHYFDTTDTLH